MTPASQSAATTEIAAPAAESLPHAPAHVQAPSPGATATLIHDMRELFKVKVVGMVLVTGWGGFYLGSMQSGISSVQPGLLDALVGIGLVSAGAGALNEALERKTDARMIRTAQRPLARGRFSLAVGILAGLGALTLGAVWLLLRTNLLTVSLALLTAFCYVAIYTPLKRVTSLATFIGAFPGAMGPLLGWTAARGHLLALSRRLRPRRHPHVARRPARRMVHCRRGALLRSSHDSRQPGSLVSRDGKHRLRRSGSPARPALSRLYHSIRRHPPFQG
jgi:protoheme IX farnesyltransferase